MQLTYTLSDLTPLKTELSNGQITTSRYKLPSPVLWSFEVPGDEDEESYTTEEHLVQMVDVSIVIVEATNKPIALVSPVDVDGEPDIDGMVDFPGVATYEGVLKELGFTPSFSSN